MTYYTSLRQLSWTAEPYASAISEHYETDDPDYVSPAVRAASRALAASAPLLSTGSPDDARLIDGFSIVFGPRR